jgi:rhamnosyltransferase
MPAATTAAVLVLHGAVGDLVEPLARLASVVSRIVLVDNNEQPTAALRALPGQVPVELLHHGNRGGLAGAYNHALQLLRQAPAPVPDQVVFLDQDSDTAALRAFLADAEVEALLARDDVAVVSPAYCDRATGLRGRYIELGRWRLHHLPRVFAGPRPVAFVINSMSVWRMQALDRIGPFNETLAIDHVDTEYCLRTRRLGLGVWVHGSHQFAHSIGERRRYRLLGRELQAGGHEPWRRRLIGRNTTWLARQWCWREPAFTGLCLMRLAYESTGILMAEDRKLTKLTALARGIAEGLFMRGRG